MTKEKLINKYIEILLILKDNKKYDTTSGYPYDEEIKTVSEFIRDLKKLTLDNTEYVACSRTDGKEKKCGAYLKGQCTNMQNVACNNNEE